MLAKMPQMFMDSITKESPVSIMLIYLLPHWIQKSKKLLELDHTVHEVVIIKWKLIKADRAVMEDLDALL